MVGRLVGPPRDGRVRPPPRQRQLRLCPVRRVGDTHRGSVKTDRPIDDLSPPARALLAALRDEIDALLLDADDKEGMG